MRDRLFLALAQFGEDAVVFEGGRVADGLFAGSDVAEEEAQDLAEGGLGEGVGEAEVVGPTGRARHARRPLGPRPRRPRLSRAAEHGIRFLTVAAPLIWRAL